MDLIIADMIPASRIHYPVIFARLLGAIVFGGLIAFGKLEQRFGSNSGPRVDRDKDQ